MTVHSDKAQVSKVKRHLLRYGSITPLDALRVYECMRLGGRIHELRQAGMDIRTLTPDTGKRYAIYTLVRGCGMEVVA